ncbi:MAG: homoserine dehydrogenase [Candidatus Omnitrophica bacterium]|nr:homoserine dehydrogenase [Candidatus Omnitrophota bacterium]MCM8828161.1 homoserine dehydrogenase [Candidatus Omnitrophota bacterium]
MRKKVNIGIIGCGVVGTQTALVLCKKKSLFSSYNGVEYRLRKACDIDWNQKRQWMPPEQLRIRDYNEIIDDPDLDIVVELIGKFQPAYEIIKRCLESGKAVVTANKFLLSKKLLELIDLANRNKTYLGFEASVAGAIPVIKSLRESFAANRINSIIGILNGTTNFILSSMTEKKQSFQDALLSARRLGYAESDPSLDISGRDSAQKLAIISTCAFHHPISDDDFLIEGIDKIEAEDIDFSSELGYRVKLLAVSKRMNDSISLRVHPALIPKNHMLADVEDVYNAVYLQGDLFGSSLLYGEGAGGRAAASAVLSDIIEIGKKISAQSHFSEHFVVEPEISIFPVERIETRYYLRFTALDRPGVLARVAEILGKNNISIASVIQKKENPEHAVPIVMLTHRAVEKNIRRAIEEIDKLSCIKKTTRMIRVEE